MRRVALLGNTSWYLWNFRRHLGERLTARGYEVLFAAPADEYTERLQAIWRFAPISLDRKGRNPLAELLTLMRVARLLRRLRPDAVLTWTPKPNIYGAIAGRLARVATIPNVAGLGYAFIGNRYLAHIVGLLYSVALRRCPVVFFQNEHDRKQFVAAGWVHEEAARLLPGSGVNLERFHPQPLRDADDFVFLFIGRLLADKGLRELVSAVRLLKRNEVGVRLHIAGFLDPGNPAAIDKDEIRGWHDEGVAEYLGRTDEPETIIAGADCIVLPSYYREGVPRALLEAAACARPIITTDAPGCRDAVIDGRTGFLCKPRDVESLADAMRKVLNLSPTERGTMGRAGRAYMEGAFSEEIVLDAYDQALAELLGRARQPAAEHEA